MTIWVTLKNTYFKLVLKILSVSGETEEEFSTRLANNLENLIIKEGPETVVALQYVSLYGNVIVQFASLA